jgi:nucleoid-associated protein YgaU
MGMLDFARSVGAKIFGGTDPEKHSEPLKPLRQHVADAGIAADGLSFRFENSVLIVEGHVPDQATREKIILIVGNVEGVGKVDDRLAVGQPPAPAEVEAAALMTATDDAAAQAVQAPSDWTTKTYTVQKGDTLSAIAKKMYGKAGLYPEIFEANQPMLKDPDRIYPGQVLRIPPIDGAG